MRRAERTLLSHPFVRYDLRTLDADAARAFYTYVAGLDFEGAAGQPPPIAAWPLHEQARARGAPPHWLGQIGVNDVEEAAQRMVDLGGQRLGPVVRTREEIPFITMRDPSGAVVGLRADPSRPARVPVAWHQHHSKDLEGALSVYASLFDWTFTRTIDVADVEGGHRLFAWDEANVGSFANTARWEGVHAQWLYYFAVPDLAEATARVRERGGIVIAEPRELLPGLRLVPCQDPQGAAFGLTAP